MNSANEPGQEPGETIGVASGVHLPDLAPPPPAAPEEEPKAVLFVSENVDLNDVLDGIEVVRVSADVIREQIERRT
jgi:hypothetical protein